MTENCSANLRGLAYSLRVVSTRIGNLPLVVLFQPRPCGFSQIVFDLTGESSFRLADILDIRWLGSAVGRAAD